MTKLGLKIGAVALITLVLLIPLGFIRGLISERTRYRAEAREDIARSWTGAQRTGSEGTGADEGSAYKRA